MTFAQRISPLVLAGSLLTASLLAACTPHEAKTAERSLSPLVGTWTRDGDVPKPDPKAPQFTELTFTPDGSLAATYVAAGGALAGVIGKAPKVQTEQDTYATPDGTTLRIVEGSSHREYQYRVSGGKLYLTPAGASGAAVFTKSQSAS
jgi:hypothetical protein